MKKTDKGIKNAIVTLLNKVKIPQTVPEIMEIISANKTSIYRALNSLIENKLINELEFGDRIKRYEISNLGHHHHLICKMCGLINEIQTDDNLEKSEKKLEQQTGFVAIAHNLEFFGICSKCNKLKTA